MGATLFDLGGRVVVVTGGLGQLGRQFTRALLDHGARVAVLDLARDGAEALRSAGLPADGERLRYLTADVTDRGSLEIALAEIQEAWGGVQGLINNAALDSP